ncbi:Major facilitator superfamily (MFS) profile domain-containing protein OS=Streptomyces griseomycini OX=66895 GN=FHS37_003370 PE=4 SV=1 [Streptomyces griseomycini]|uniref:Major facilitator superfamily (MFS) profile domain-containing protein n=1 Tax=Streptomyces griseomycini TaxID=66895 RepID=A0A7W7LZF7_9ACTN|nr:hypothetical protein [Streptomyces griseomycini]GGR35452.1 hypothetical protein GCM10015536_46410 [Streptomyces griseomycini]
MNVGGRTLRYLAERSEKIGAGTWQTATALALITGARQDLAPLVLTGPAFLRPDDSAFSAYREALHAYLGGTDPEPAVRRALEQAEKAKDWGSAMPPAVLLSQLVEGDEESFNLALADALEAHRDYYQVADRTDDPDAGVNLDVLALACHARRRGWAIRVVSPYLPQSLLRAARSFKRSRGKEGVRGGSAVGSGGADFGVGGHALTWVVVGCTITGGRLLMLGGRPGDVLGRRRILLLGTALSGAASLLAGLAPSFAVLVPARLLQGAGERSRFRRRWPWSCSCSPRGRAGRGR